MCVNPFTENNITFFTLISLFCAAYRRNYELFCARYGTLFFYNEPIIQYTPVCVIITSSLYFMNHHLSTPNPPLNSQASQSASRTSKGPTNHPKNPHNTLKATKHLYQVPPPLQSTTGPAVPGPNTVFPSLWPDKTPRLYPPAAPNLPHRKKHTYILKNRGWITSP